jgi:ELWxxDGT repeat protein
MSFHLSSPSGLGLARAALFASIVGLTFSHAASVEDDSLLSTAFSNGQSALLNGKALLVVNDGVHGSEIWVSDGTSDSTFLLRDIRAGAAGSDPRNLTTIGSFVYFSADNGMNGAELWRTDGTTAGTVLVRDLVTGNGSSVPANFTAVGATVFFTAQHPTSGRELWKTDGTAAGTVLVADIAAGASSSQPLDLTAVGSTLFFSADAPLTSSSPGKKNKGSSSTTIGRELWKSNGTAAGTVLVKDIFAGFNGSHPHELVAHNGVLIFAASVSGTGAELWRSDGTSGGTTLVREITAGQLGSSPRNFAALNGALYFNAGPAVLWRTDGTPAGTVPVPNLTSSFTHMIGPRVGNKLSLVVENSNGTELWATDGTPAGTQFLHRLLPNDPNLVELGMGFRPNIQGAGSLLFFNAFTFEDGITLHATDGTPGGTGLVRNFSPDGRDIRAIMFLGGEARVFFISRLGETSGLELWVSAGTDASTHIVHDFLVD